MTDQARDRRADIAALVLYAALLDRASSLLADRLPEGARQAAERAGQARDAAGFLAAPLEDGPRQLAAATLRARQIADGFAELGGVELVLDELGGERFRLVRQRFGEVSRRRWLLAAVTAELEKRRAAAQVEGCRS